ncbi:hypothetical protein DVH24_036579 [Malus domestica]|uniref:Uncharacterized protein n=1 Tax=Malus domestica TaxID=3750 RepID=A0A498IF88_MALDO|nr:hypothetical protein DVH24_036579 [Malus domestica]
MVVLMLVAYMLAQSWFRPNWLNLPKTLKKLTGLHPLYHPWILSISTQEMREEDDVDVFGCSNPTLRMCALNSCIQFIRGMFWPCITTGQYIYVKISPHFNALPPFYGEAAPKSQTRDLPLMGEGTCHRTKCDLLREGKKDTEKKKTMPGLLIDGPYVAPSQDYKK